MLGEDNLRNPRPEHKLWVGGGLDGLARRYLDLRNSFVESRFRLGMEYSTKMPVFN